MITIEKSVSKTGKNYSLVKTLYSGTKNPSRELEVMVITSSTRRPSNYKGWKLIESSNTELEPIEGYKEKQWAYIYYRLTGKPTIKDYIHYYFREIKDFPKVIKEIYEKQN